MARTAKAAAAAASATATPEATETPERPKRADARRNYDLLLAAASEVYAERGAEASLEEIARRAGVGIGTLYRHFPARTELTEAVYRHGVEQLCDGVDELLAARPADVALSVWMRRFAAYVATKKGMGVALKSVLGADNELFTYSRRRIREALQKLVDAAVDSGAICSQIDVDDLLRGMSGICMTTETPADVERSARLIELLIDGLRFRAPEPS